MERFRGSSCDFSFLSDRLTLDLHRFDEIGGRCSFERQSVANFPHNTLFQGLNKVYACVAACHFRSLQVQLCQFPRRLSALPFGTTSATTPHACAVRTASGCGCSRNASARATSARNSTWSRCRHRAQGLPRRAAHPGRSRPRPPQSHWHVAHTLRAHGRVPR